MEDQKTPKASACPRCQRTNAYCVTSVSAISSAWYFRCPDCGEVWAVEKTAEELKLINAA